MFAAEISIALAENTPTISVGTAQLWRDPDFVVTVLNDGRPVLQVGVRAEFEPGTSPFTAAIVWRGWLAIGHWSRLHLINLATHEVKGLPMPFYFGSLTVGPEYLLAASASTLTRIEPDGTVLWTSEEVGIDGVIVSAATEDRIEGQGEWDPPGGWLPFVLDARTGKGL